MAESAGEKTEQPTPTRLREARQRGNIARSTDMTAASILLGGVLILWVMGMHLMQSLKFAVEAILGASHAGNPTRPDDVTAVTTFAGKQFMLAIAPITLILTSVTLVATMGQVGFLLTGRPLVPKLEKISPLKGVKRLFDMRALMRLVMNLLKIILIASVAMWMIHSDLPLIVKLAELSPVAAMMASGGIVFNLAVKLALLLFMLAVPDYFFQRFQRIRDLRMTKQEVKEEMKNMDGDPEIKRRRAQIARQLAMQRMAQEVPKADVIVTNPTHYAVALRYDAETMTAPKVIAKGADLMAMRIRQIAAAHGVPLVERKALARTLYRNVNVGQEIPGDLYSAVAEIMAYVYRLRKRSA